MVAINFLSYFLNLYRNEAIVWWDEAMHFLTTFAFTLLLVTYLYGRTLTGARNHRLLFVLNIILVGVALGAVWEFYEWVREQTTPQETMIINKYDTMIDLLMDAIGATITGTVAIFILRKTETGE